MDIIEVVEVAERSRVVDIKIQGFATKCHIMSRMPNSLGIILARLLLTVRHGNVEVKLYIIEEYCTTLYTFYVSRMKGDQGTYYLLKMSNLRKNYVALLAKT